MSNFSDTTIYSLPDSIIEQWTLLKLQNQKQLSGKEIQDLFFSINDFNKRATQLVDDHNWYMEGEECNNVLLIVSWKEVQLATSNILNISIAWDVTLEKASNHDLFSELLEKSLKAQGFSYPQIELLTNIQSHLNRTNFNKFCIFALDIEYEQLHDFVSFCTTETMEDVKVNRLLEMKNYSNLLSLSKDELLNIDNLPSESFEILKDWSDLSLPWIKNLIEFLSTQFDFVKQDLSGQWWTCGSTYPLVDKSNHLLGIDNNDYDEVEHLIGADNAKKDLLLQFTDKYNALDTKYKIETLALIFCWMNRFESDTILKKLVWLTEKEFIFIFSVTIANTAYFNWTDDVDEYVFFNLLFSMGQKEIKNFIQRVDGSTELSLAEVFLYLCIVKDWNKNRQVLMQISAWTIKTISELNNIAEQDRTEDLEEI